jgi:hypothetical protein
MKKNQILIIAIISVPSAIVVVVVLKFLGYDNPEAIVGGVVVAVVGGVIGALSSLLLKKKEL